MDVVSTVEFVGIIIFLVNLDLNAVMVEAVFLAEHFVDCLESALLLTILVGVQDHVAGE